MTARINSTHNASESRILSELLFHETQILSPTLGHYRFIAGHFVFTDRRSIEARPMRNRLIFQCDCFARFAVVRRHLAGDYEILLLSTT